MALLKGKKLQRRLEEFAEWRDTIDERLITLNYWHQNLKYSPESLVELENSLLDRFSDPMSAYKLENANFFDAVTTYIGEVYIRNIPETFEWDVTNQFASKLYKENHLVVSFNGNYNFHFSLDQSPYVKIEANEIVKSYEGSSDISKLKLCHSRVEFWGDEDPNGDYMNEYLFILQELSDLPFLAYNIQSGEISNLV